MLCKCSGKYIDIYFILKITYFSFIFADILIIGVGDKGNALSPRVLQYIRNKGVNIEVIYACCICIIYF